MDEQTFLTKVNQTEDCWLWTKAKTPAGYGIFTRQNKPLYAHHQAWRLWKSPDLPVVIRHTCRNRHCVNPAHLEGGTHKENNGPDRVRDGTDNKGERHGNHTLTEEQVVEMRRLRRDGLSLEALTQRFQVTNSCVLHALTGVRWVHVPDPLTKEEMKETRKPRATKLTDEQKAEVRRRFADGVTKTRLAEDFGVTTNTITAYLV